MRIITRKEWGAKYSAGFGPAPTASEVWLHHSAGSNAGPNATEAEDVAVVRSLENIGQQRFGGGISYTFIVTQAGRVFEGTGAGRRGAHTGGRNTVARAICWPGNYDNTKPTDAQLNATADLLCYGEGRDGYWQRGRLDGGHQNAPGASTGCPGRNAMAAIPTINHLAATGGHEEDDMTPEQEQMLREAHQFAQQARDAIGRLEGGYQGSVYDHVWRRQSNSPDDNFDLPPEVKLDWTVRNVLAIAKLMDVQVLAAQIAEAVGPGVTDDQLETVLRRVLGSLDTQAQEAK